MPDPLFPQFVSIPFFAGHARSLFSVSGFAFQWMGVRSPSGDSDVQHVQHLLGGSWVLVATYDCGSWREPIYIYIHIHGQLGDYKQGQGIP